MSNLMVLPKKAELSAELRERVIVCEEVDYATFHDEELVSMWCDLRRRGPTTKYGRRRVMADAAPEPACKRNRTLSDQSERPVA